MTLPTSVNFKIGPFGAAKEDVFYELNFFPRESYSRIHTLEFEGENFNESASRSGVADIIVKVKKIQRDTIHPERPFVIEVMNMAFSNPAVGTPWFEYKVFAGESYEEGFEVNTEKVFEIPCDGFGPFLLDVRRTPDGCPIGQTICTSFVKNWQVVFGHNA